MHIKDIMSHPVVSAPEHCAADAIARLMWEFDCGFVPIVTDDGRLKGVVTDRDLCMAAYTQGKPLAEVDVSSAMADTVVSCRPEDTIEHVEHLMRDYAIRRIPVVDADDRPVGIVTMNDLARLAAHLKRNGRDRELVQALAAICQPRGGTPIGPNVAAA